MRQAVKVALVAAAIIALPREGLSATITVHEPDGEGRVFVDIVGTINDEDFKTFTEKTDQIYPIGAGRPIKRVIVTLTSYGGKANPALQIGDRIRRRSMSTFVPGDRTCTSACALMWLAGAPRTVGDTPRIGFHAIYDPTTRQPTGDGNAVVGAYLRDLGIGYKAIAVMTRKGPASVEWLSPELAKELGVAWGMLDPPRTIAIAPQPKLQRGLEAPPQIIAAWSQAARSHAETKRKFAEAEQQRLAVALKAEQNQKARPTPSHTNALFEIRPNIEAREQSQAKGGTIYLGYVDSLDDCQQLCQASTNCNVFTFRRTTRFCYSYSSADLVPNGSFDSGVRQSVAATVVRPKAEIEQPNTSPVMGKPSAPPVPTLPWLMPRPGVFPNPSGAQ
jgi:hypothetical protein